MRLAARHGVREVSRFACSIGLSFRDVIAGRNVTAVAAKAGLDSIILANFSPQIDARSRTVVLGGEVIMLGDWSRATRRFCPACISEDIASAALMGRHPAAVAHHRAIWDVRSIENCPVHRLGLLDACPVCGEQISWRHGPVHICEQGCNMAIGVGSGDAAVAFDAYLAARLGFGSTENQPLLGGLAYRRVVRLCERIGRVATLGWQNRLPRQSQQQDSVSQRTGFGMLAQWPAMLFEALDLVVAASSVQHGSGLIQRYGWIYPDWLAVEDDEVTAIVGPLLREHAVRNAIIAENEPVLGHRPTPTLSLRQIVRNSGMGFDRCRKAMDQAGLIPEGSRRGVSFTIDPTGAAAVLNGSVRSGLTRQAAATYLGIGRSRIGDLLGAGLLDRRDALIEHDSVDALLSVTIRSCDRQSAPPSARPLLAACKSAGVPLVQALVEVASRTVRAWFDDRAAVTGLAAIRIVPGELAARARPDRPLSLAQASDILGVHPQCVGQLVAAGEIKRLSGRGLDRASVARFSRAHVAVARIARATGQTPRVCIEELERQGTGLSFGPPHFRQALISRHRLQ